MSVVKGIIVPGLPHPLLCPEQNQGWNRLRQGFDQAAAEIEATDADVIVVYSTMWPSIIGHQFQADPAPTWVHVDELFHDLGSIPYTFRIDSELAEAACQAAKARNLQARTVSYHGFPIDTGSVVALKLLNPNNRLPAIIVSSNVYSDRAETIVLGKAIRDALKSQGKKAVVVAVMTLSNRLFTDWIEPSEDHIHSLKDDEWNRKILEFVGDGRLEDLAQLSREIHRQVRVKKVVNFKPFWWLSAVMGQHNHYEGDVLAYEALYGTGGAVATLTPSSGGIGDKEFDEDDVEVFGGNRGVLSAAPTGSASRASAPSTQSNTTRPPTAPRTSVSTSSSTSNAIVATSAAPTPVGAYPHARRVGDLLYLSGVGPRQPVTNDIPGGPIRDAQGQPRDYDIRAQTRAVINNVRIVLESAGSSLDKVVDITSFLVDMDRDFAGYNEVYAEYFTDIQAARTTLAVSALPTPIAVEFKVIARP